MSQKAFGDEGLATGVGFSCLVFVLPIRTTNPLNGSRGVSKVAALCRQRVRREHHAVARMVTAAALARAGLRPAAMLPVLVTLTRESAGTMDTDGLAASQKGVRDGIAAALCIDDGAAGIRWRYRQRKGPRGAHCVWVEIAPDTFEAQRKDES